MKKNDVYNSDLNYFLNSTADIGNNFNFVQGAGGNTSYKYKDSMLVKASGLKLKNAAKEDIFVEVNLKELKNNLKNKKSDPLKGTWDESKGLKPSIETYMHAILPHKYIFHVHCLNTLSFLVQKGFEKQFSTIFKNFKYAVIKYEKPGILLAEEIEKSLENFVPNIIFLSNHGLVVGSDCLDEVLEILYFVSNNLSNLQTQNKLIDKDKLKAISINSKFRPPKYEGANQIALSKRNIEIIKGGSLFPDQVVFLGKDPFVVFDSKNLQNIISYKNSKKLQTIIIPELGILVPKNIKKESEELLLALNLIISQIPNNVEINYLKKEEENELINSQEEKYRLELNNI